MKSIKSNAVIRIIVFCFVVVLISSALHFSLFTVSAAENTSYHTVFSIESARGKPGETIGMKISVSGDTEISGLLLYEITYDDSALEFIGFDSYGELVTSSTAGVNSVNGSIINLGYSPNIIPEGTLCSASFRIKDNAKDGNYTVSFSTIGSSDNGKEVPSILNEGTVGVYTWLAGDFDGNEKVDMLDAVHFIGWVNFSYIPDLYPMLYEGNKDFNHDGKIDMYDAVYFIGWINFSYIPGLYDIDWFGETEHHHDLSMSEAKSATCTEDGNIAYWYCSKCEKYFSDVNGNTEITLESTVIPATGHTYSEEWSFDEQYHWHAATCEDKDTIIFNETMEPHIWDENHKCSVCGYTEEHIVKFVDYNGATIQTQSVEHCGSAELPSNPRREGYTFAGWDKSFDNITEDLTVTAQYDEFFPKITFKYIDSDNEEKTVTSAVKYGSIPVPPSANEISEYKFVWKDQQGKNKYYASAFSRWADENNNDLMPATKDTTYEAVYDGDFDRPIVAVYFSTDDFNYTVDTRIVLCNLKKNDRKLYVFNFEMSYKAEGVTYSILKDNGVEFNNSAGWFKDSGDNYTCEWNNKDNYKTMSVAWSTPNLSPQSNGTAITNDFENIITVHFSTQGTINNKYIAIAPDSCSLIMSDDGGETMQVIQPIILYNYN